VPVLIRRNGLEQVMLLSLWFFRHCTTQTPATGRLSSFVTVPSTRAPRELTVISKGPAEPFTTRNDISGRGASPNRASLT
jgi:hypothetical protein